MSFIATAVNQRRAVSCIATAVNHGNTMRFAVPTMNPGKSISFMSIFSYFLVSGGILSMARNNNRRIHTITQRHVSLQYLQINRNRQFRGYFKYIFLEVEGLILSRYGTIATQWKAVRSYRISISSTILSLSCSFVSGCLRWEPLTKVPDRLWLPD